MTTRRNAPTVHADPKYRRPRSPDDDLGDPRMLANEALGDPRMLDVEALGDPRMLGDALRRVGRDPARVASRPDLVEMTRKAEH